MFIVLPCLFFIILFQIFCQLNNQTEGGYDWRDILIKTTVVFGFVVFLLFEFLSIFNRISYVCLVMTWVLMFGICLIIYLKLRIRQGKFIRNFTIPKLPSFLIFLLFCIFFYIAMTLIISLRSPPNNWDSMTYHMARIMHWIQNGSLAYYPTAYPPQIYHPPLAEIMIMNFQILSGGDYFANLIQWLAMVFCAICVSSIAKELGTKIRGQIFASVFLVTIPMGILQSSSTQNDYIVSLWVAFCVYFILKSRKQMSLYNAFFIGLSLGLAFYTKVTAYIIVFPFLVWFMFIVLKRSGRKFIKYLFVIIALVLLINCGYYLRNIELFGAPISAPDQYQKQYKIETYNYKLFISNFMKNTCMHSDIIRNLHLQSFITPTTGIAEVALSKLHKLINVDINDTRITDGRYIFSGLSYDENTAGNPYHFFLVFLTTIFFIFNFKRKKDNLSATYGISIFFSFCLFCLLIKWQIYNTRHHLVLFILLAPFVGKALSEFRYKIVSNLLIFIAIISSLQFIFLNKSRPLAGSNSILKEKRKTFTLLIENGFKSM